MLFRKDTIPPSPEINKKVRESYNAHRPESARATACFAPTKNLYFGHHGRTSSCCYNRHYVLGTYPQQSIREIWFGERAEKLRNHLGHYNFSLGCEGCKYALVAGNLDGLKSTMYDGHPLNKNHYPSVFEFELSNLCNLECVMCNGDFSSLIRRNREKRNELLIPYDEDFIRQLNEFIPHLAEVKFYGGEPFLVELYYAIWEKIIALNPAIRISVQTNGTILNNRVKEILSKTNFHINLSLDSLQKENYEAIRVNAKFERVMENLRYFHSYCKEKNTFFGISACMMTENWHEAPDFVRFCNGLNIPVYFHTVAQPAKYALSRLDEGKLAEICGRFESELPQLPSGNEFERKNHKHYTDFLSQVKEWRSLSKSIKKNEALNKVRTVEELADYVTTKTLARKDLPQAEKESKISAFKKKLSLLEQSLPLDFDLTGHLVGIISREDESLYSFMDSFEAISIEEMKDHLRTFYQAYDI